MVRVSVAPEGDLQTAGLEFRLAGYPEVWLNGQAVALKLRRGLALLAYLCETGLGALRTQLAELLWPDAPFATGRTRLRRLCHEVNGAPGMELLQGDADVLWLAVPGSAFAGDLAQSADGQRQGV